MIRSHARRLFGFALVPAVSILSSVVLLPLISHKEGSAGWTALSVGQSIGALVSFVVGMAWPVFGGQLIAKTADRARRIEIFELSVVSRLIVLTALMPFSSAACFLLVDDLRLETALFMLGVATNGLSAQWYFTGSGQPYRLLINEGLVRTSGYAVSVVALTLGAGIEFYAFATAVAGLLMLVLNWLYIVRRAPSLTRVLVRESLSEIRDQTTGTLTRMSFATLKFGGPTIYSIFAPASLPLYAALYQLLVTSNNALATVPSAFVSWVGEARGREQRRRQRLSGAAVTAIGVGVLVVACLLLPRVTRWLFAGHVEIGFAGSALLSVAIVASLFERSYEMLAVVPRALLSSLYWLTLSLSLIGVLLLIAASITLGPYGAIASWTLTTTLLTALLWWTVRRHDAASQVQSYEEVAAPSNGRRLRRFLSP